MPDMLGYCCICESLRKPAKTAVYCSRTLQKKTFSLEEASNRALQNCKDLLTILKWNEDNNIKVFRISSDLFPRFTCAEKGYLLDQLKDHKEIRQVLAACGDYAYKHDMLLSFHPGPFTTLASPNEKSRLNGIKEVEYHALLVSLIDPNDRLDIPINYHIGGTYGGEYEATAERFIASWESLSPLAKRQTVIENDDKKNGWSVAALYEHIYKPTDIPITFDIHHHKFCTGDMSMQSAFFLARSTWGDRSMQVHYSQSPTDDKFIPKHSDYYRAPIPWFITQLDNIHYHLECKQKELALIDYRNKLQGNKHGMMCLTSLGYRVECSV